MKKYIQKLKEEKTTSFNIVIFSVILSTIINIVSTKLLELININPIVYILSGCAITIFLIMISLIYKVRKLNSTTKYTSMFIINTKNKNSLICIPNYKINNDMCRYLRASFVENKAMKNIWENGNWNNIYSTLETGHNDSVDLLHELIEYCILENFSVFISDYFNLLNLNSKVMKLTRESVPDILLSNRFLKLFSEEMNNRDAFIETPNMRTQINLDGQKTICASGKNGELYRNFHLSLPKGTKVYKKDNRSLIIDTKLFILTIEYCFGGFSTVIPQDFYKYYIGKDYNFDYHNYKFYINMHVKYKLSSIFKVLDWKYYNWLDEYVERLEHYCDMKAFFNDICWKNNSTLIRILNNQNTYTKNI